MWFLSCDGDLFGGKRIWLRPGTTHLLGRTSGTPTDGERVQFINHKNVSRKHLILNVSEVIRGSSIQVHVKPQVQATDSSKSGTTINGEKILQNTKILDGNSFTIKLGSFDTTFELSWRPVILSFTNVPKGAKPRAAFMESYFQQLEHAGVKLVTDFLTNQTTHVIAKKRNTAAGLEALVQGKWLITDAWVDKLAKACRPGTGGNSGDNDHSPLEKDFEVNWPSEEPYIVPPGAEPVPRPNNLLKPDPARCNVLDGYIFVFLSQTQYSSLLSVITSASGKALLYEFVPGTTTAEDVVDFVRGLGNRHENKSSLRSASPFRCNAVVVRTSVKDEGRSGDLREIDLSLDQRSIEQNEFLDAFVMNDARPLRRQLQVESSDPAADEAHQRPSPAASDSSRLNRANFSVPSSQPVVPRNDPTNDTTDLNPNDQPAETDEPKRKRRRIIQSRFEGFNDFDPSQIIRSSVSPEPHKNDSNQYPDDDEGNVADPSVSNMNGRTSRITKEEEAKRALDSLFPGAAAMKQRRTDRTNQHRDHLSGSSGKSVPVPVTERKKSSADVDFKAKMKARMDREEEQRRLDEQSIKEALNVDVDTLGDVAQVEIFELPIRTFQHRQGVSHNSRDRQGGWNPAWNGRPNYKNFRPQGQQRDSVLELPRVSIALEEVSSRSHAFDDSYWTEANVTHGPGGGQRRSQSTIGNSHDASLRNRTTIPSSDSREEREQEAFQVRRQIDATRQQDAENLSLDRLMRDENSASSFATSNPELQLTIPNSTASVSNKRTAASQSLVASPAKRIRQSRRTDIDASDEDDPLKFRRKRR